LETAFRTQKFDAAEILGQSIQLIKLGAARLLPDRRAAGKMNAIRILRSNKEET